MHTTVRLELGESGADALRLDTLHRQLRSDLAGLHDVDTVALASGPAVTTPGTRGIDAATASTLAVALLGSGGLTGVVAAVRAWLSRGSSAAARSVRLEVGGDVLELSGASSAEQDRLVAVFLDRVAGRLDAGAGGEVAT